MRRASAARIVAARPGHPGQGASVVLALAHDEAGPDAARAAAGAGASALAQAHDLLGSEAEIEAIAVEEGGQSPGERAGAETITTAHITVRTPDGSESPEQGVVLALAAALAANAGNPRGPEPDASVVGATTTLARTDPPQVLMEMHAMTMGHLLGEQGRFEARGDDMETPERFAQALGQAAAQWITARLAPLGWQIAKATTGVRAAPYAQTHPGEPPETRLVWVVEPCKAYATMHEGALMHAVSTGS